MDPVTGFAIGGLVAAIVSAIFAGTGPIMGRLWRAIKGFYGRVCKSRSYLENLGRQRLTYDLQTMLSRDQGLQRASQQYYLGSGRGGGRGGRDDGLMSDFSDFSE